MSGSADLRLLLMLVWHRRWSVLLTGLAVGAMIAAVRPAVPRLFGSEGLLQLAMSPDPAGQATARTTEEDVLRSPGLLVALISSLHLDAPGSAAKIQTSQPSLLVAKATGLADAARRMLGGARPVPDTAAIRRAETEDVFALLQAHLKVGGEPASQVVSISLDTPDPDLSATVINRYMQLYIQQAVAAKRAASGRAIQWLSARVAAARRDDDLAEARVRSFEAAHDPLAVQAGTIDALAVSNEQARLSAAEEALLQAEAAAGANGAPDDAALPSAAGQALRQREAELMAQDAAAADMGPLNPARAAIKQQLRAVRDAIAAEARRSGSTASRQIDYATRRLSEARSAVAAAQAKANESNAADAELARLKQDAQTKHTLYQSLESKLDDLNFASSQVDGGRIVSDALPAIEPNPSHRSVIMLLGLFGGMLLSSSIVVLRQLLSPAVLGRQDLPARVRSDGIGTLPPLRLRRRDPPILALSIEDSPIAETLRGLRLSLQSIARSGPCMRVLVTSAEIGEGKSTVSAAFARRSAADGLRVLLVEADLRRPSLLATLAPCLDTHASLKPTCARSIYDRIDVDPATGLHCLLSRGSHSNAMTWLGGTEFAQLVSQTAYDMVVIDSPPLLHVADAVLLSRHADVVLFTVKAGSTRVAACEEALARFPDDVFDRVLPLLTHVRIGRANRAGYYSGYGGRHVWGAEPNLMRQLAAPHAQKGDREHC